MQNRVAGRDTTAEITRALTETLTAIGGPDPGSQTWRWRVRRSLTGVRDVLEADTLPSSGWLAARAETSQRAGAALLARWRAVAPRVLVEPEVAAVVTEVTRLLADTQRHFQRRNDLAYDEVELELGGSE